MNNNDVSYINEISYGYWKAQAFFLWRIKNEICLRLKHFNLLMFPAYFLNTHKT